MFDFTRVDGDLKCAGVIIRISGKCGECKEPALASVDGVLNPFAGFGLSDARILCIAEVDVTFTIIVETLVARRRVVVSNAFATEVIVFCLDDTRGGPRLGILKLFLTFVHEGVDGWWDDYIKIGVIIDGGCVIGSVL